MEATISKLDPPPRPVLMARASKRHGREIMSKRYRVEWTNKHGLTGHKTGLFSHGGANELAQMLNDHYNEIGMSFKACQCFCPLCSQPSDSGAPHEACADAETARSDQGG